MSPFRRRRRCADRSSQTSTRVSRAARTESSLKTKGVAARRASVRGIPEHWPRQVFADGIASAGECPGLAAVGALEKAVVPEAGGMYAAAFSVRSVPAASPACGEDGGWALGVDCDVLDAEAGPDLGPCLPTVGRLVDATRRPVAPAALRFVSVRGLRG